MQQLHSLQFVHMHTHRRGVPGSCCCQCGEPATLEHAHPGGTLWSQWQGYTQCHTCPQRSDFQSLSINKGGSLFDVVHWQLKGKLWVPVLSILNGRKKEQFLANHEYSGACNLWPHKFSGSYRDTATGTQWTLLIMSWCRNMQIISVFGLYCATSYIAALTMLTQHGAVT